MVKKIAMLIAFREFRDEEYFIPKQIFEANGAQVITVSSSLGTAVGKLGGDTEIDVLIGDLKAGDYDAVLFIGGPGAVKYINDEKCREVARETIENNKILGAICVAPAILAKAGALSGKKATVWSSSLDRTAVKILKEGGAIYREEPVVVDGNIVTASGPAAAKNFALSIINVLK